LEDVVTTTRDRYDYDAWGTLVASEGTTPNTRLYVSENRDPDMGLVELRARQYDPAAGRFITSDPARGRPLRPISFNRYLYAGADPANRTDPLGRMDAAETAFVLGFATNTVINLAFLAYAARLSGNTESPYAIKLPEVVKDTIDAWASRVIVGTFAGAPVGTAAFGAVAACMFAVGADVGETEVGAYAEWIFCHESTE
jgi:RHS repeat-associated protein